jgi:hypothetical protein
VPNAISGEQQPHRLSSLWTRRGGSSMTGRLRAGAVGAGAKRFDLVPTVSGGKRRLPSERALLWLKEEGRKASFWRNDDPAAR